MTVESILDILNKNFEDEEPLLVLEYDDGYVFTLKSERERNFPIVNSHVHYVYKVDGDITEMYMPNLCKKQFVKSLND